jgi:hypothetical protein
MLILYQVELLSMGTTCTMCECWMCTRWDVECVPSGGVECVRVCTRWDVDCVPVEFVE